MNSPHISTLFVGIPGGLLMAIIAFSIVFLVIVGLMLVMFITKTIARTVEGKGQLAQQQPPSHTTVTVVTPPVQPLTSASTGTAASDDEELVAVISAAVAVACGAGARVIGFAPVALQPRHGQTTWRVTGRLQNCEGFDD